MSSLPSDFSLCYEWHEASIPPPDHYFFFIELTTAGPGLLRFCPDYERNQPPVWQEEFQIPREQLAAIYLLLREQQFFTGFKADKGGSSGENYQLLSGSVAGQPFSLASSMAGHAQVQQLYSMIRELVPEQQWQKMWQRQEQYQQEMLERS